MKTLIFISMLFVGCGGPISYGMAVQDCVTSHIKALNRNNAEIPPQLYERMSDECRENFKAGRSMYQMQ